MRRALIWRDDDGWWRWSCGWSTCMSGGRDRSREAVQDRFDGHHRKHREFGFQPSRPPTRR